MAAANDEKLKELLSSFMYQDSYWLREQLFLNILKDASPLLRYNIIKEVSNFYYHSALHKAATMTTPKIVELMLKDLDSDQIFELIKRTGSEKTNVMHHAVKDGAADTVIYLLCKTNMSAIQKCELLFAQDKSGNTALHYAAENKNQIIVGLILDSLTPKQQAYLMYVDNKKKKSAAEMMKSLNKEIATRISEGKILKIILHIYPKSILFV